MKGQQGDLRYMEYRTNTPPRRRKRKKNKGKMIGLLIVFLFGFVLGVLLTRAITKRGQVKKSTGNSYIETTTTDRLKSLCAAEIPSWIDQQIIPLDDNSRNGTPLGGMNDIVIHYVGNPGTTAQDNHDYYVNPESDVSSHFIVGLKGEIIQCIPLGEMSAASNWRNRDTISIEVCHPDESGKFTKETYQSLVKLTSWLMHASMLDETHIIRHHDITGKDCPLYYVEHEDAWLEFIDDVKNYK